jgi:hypothetical protein
LGNQTCRTPKEIGIADEKGGGTESWGITPEAVKICNQRGAREEGVVEDKIYVFTKLHQ